MTTTDKVLKEFDEFMEGYCKSGCGCEPNYDFSLNSGNHPGAGCVPVAPTDKEIREFISTILTETDTQAYRRGVEERTNGVITKIQGRARDEMHLNPNGLTVDLLLQIIEEARLTETPL